MKMRSKMQNQKGFTLVELMVVVVILGILVAIAVPVYNAVTTNAEKSAVMANLRTIDGAIQTYYATDPAATALTADGGVQALVNAKYLASKPTGPKDAAYAITGEKPNQVANVSGTVGGVTTALEKVTLADLKKTDGSYKW